VQRLREPTSTPSAGPQFNCLTGHLAELLDTARREFDRDRDAAKAALITASSVLQLELERHSKTSGVRLGGLAAWQVLRVQSFIDRNLHRTIGIKELCTVAQRSPAHFARSFKQALGAPPHAYIVKMRLQRACHLMMNTTAPLSEIALASGFSDQAHLCKLFRQTFGQSPSSWRRKCESQEKLNKAIAELSSDREQERLEPRYNRSQGIEGQLGKEPQVKKRLPRISDRQSKARQEAAAHRTAM
jgi:AraC family transcriptional regulator